MRAATPSSLPYGWRVMLWCGLLAWGAYLCAGNAPLWQIGAGVLVTGLAMAHGVLLQHQAVHNTGFTSRRANEIWGVVLGLPALVSFYEYRISHLFHHANLGKPVHSLLYNRLPKKWGQRKPKKAQGYLVAHYIRMFLPHCWLVLRGRPLEHHVYHYSEVQQRQFKRFYLLGCGFIAFLAALSLALGTWLPLAVWFAALTLVAAPIYAVFELPEHRGCDTRVTDIHVNTRSIRSNFFLQWFSHYNNLHAEHHLEPKTAFHLLPLVHARVSGQLRESSSGYIDFYIDYFRRIRPMVKRWTLEMGREQPAGSNAEEAKRGV